jgi:signal transduction histidine kinase
MVAVPWREIHEFEHFVQFCETDEFLITSVGKFISAGLMQGDTCIVPATQAHRDGFDEHLKAQGLAVSVARARGKYISLDAASTLSQIMVDGSIDQTCFYAVIGEIIQQAVKGGHSVRVFGELVALLWVEGNRAGAIHLEELWNELSRRYAFSLYCAYPMEGFDGEAYESEFAEICRQHARVIPGESYITLTNSDERLRAISLLQQKSNSLETEVVKRKQVEAALLESEARFRFLAESFISTTSHELKTPVTSLKGFAHILQNRLKKRGDEESLRFLASMNKQLNRLTRLINDLQDITRVQQGRLEYDEELFSLDALVRENVENLQVGTSTHRLLFEESQAAQVYGDKDRIGQVLTNLITNAVKYSPEADRVIIRLFNDGDNAVVSVQDFGIGIAAKHQGRIFERFYQVADPEEKTYPGLGIGLYLSSEIIKRHRGCIQVESENGVGSTFSFSLPLATAD